MWKFSSIGMGSQALPISCIALYLLLIFYIRDLARVGFYLLALVGLFIAYQEVFKNKKCTLIKYSAVIGGVLFLLAIYLSQNCCINTENYYKPYLHLLIIFPFVLLNCVFNGWIRIILNASILLVISAIFSYSYSEFTAESIDYFEDHYDIYLLLAPIVFLVYKNYISTKLLLTIFMTACLFAGLSFLFDITNITRSDLWLLDKYKSQYPRFGANIHSIQFATIAASFLSITIVFLIIKRKEISRTHFIIGCLCVLSAVASVIASGTRGVWIAMPFMVIVIVFLVYQTIFSRILSLVGAIIILLLVSKVPLVNDRIDLAIYQLNEYMGSTNISDPIRESAVGVRMEIWRVAWQVYKENPILGVGPGVLSMYMKARGYASTGKYNKKVVLHRNPHNMYVKALSDRGTIGFIALSLILLLPLSLFFASMKNYTNSTIRALSGSGIVVILIYAISGLTIGALDNRQTSMCYIFCIGILSGMLLRKKDNLRIQST